MNDTTAQALFGVAAPLLVGAAAALAAPRAAGTPSVAPSGARRGRAAIAAALPAVAAGAAFLALEGLPREQWQSLAWTALAGAGLAALGAVLPGRGWRTPLLALLAAAIAAVTAWPIVARESALVRLIPAVGALLIVLGAEPLLARRRGASIPIALALAFGATAGMILLSGFLRLAVPVAAAGFAIGAVGLVGLVRRGGSLPAGSAAGLAPLLAAAPTTAALYMGSAGDPFPALAFALPAGAVLAAWVGEIPRLARGPAWLAAGLRWGLVLAVAGVGFALALRGEGEAAGDDPYEQMYRDMMG